MISRCLRGMAGGVCLVLVKTSDGWRNKGPGGRAGSEARLVPYTSSICLPGLPAASDAFSAQALRIGSKTLS